MAEIPLPPFQPGELARAVGRIMPPPPAPVSEQAAPPPAPTELDWPPGMAGHLAQLIFAMSIRPVKEVSVASAISILAGVCGLGWNTHTGTGLNLYMALVARSAVGKEAIAEAPGMLTDAALEERGRFATNFFVYDDFASGPALLTGLKSAPSVLQIAGEFGHTIRMMANDKSGPFATLRQQMTKLYPKSGKHSKAGGTAYSNEDKNTTLDGAVSYSIIGDTTPVTFFEALSSSMMADGFMSRFLVIEYNGPRPPENENRREPGKEWGKWFADLTDKAYDMRVPTTVEPDPDARSMLKGFNLHCDAQINATDDENRRVMWNRAQLKALKVAGLLAVADNHTVPVITVAQAEWAIKLILRDIAAFTKRLDGGDVGDGDDARQSKLVAVLKEYLKNPVPDSYKVKDDMRKNGIVPTSYLQIRMRPHAAFSNHKLGANRALADALYAMLSAGYLMEVDKSKMVEAYSYHGKCYRVIRLPSH